MADLNGFEATRRLAGDEATAAIPVIAVSASAWDEVRDAAREAGCVDFLPKPVRADVLFARLQRYTRVRFVSPIETMRMPPLPPIGSLATGRRGSPSAARIREAAAIGSVAELDAIADELSTAGDAPGTLGRRIAVLDGRFRLRCVVAPGGVVGPTIVTTSGATSMYMASLTPAPPGGPSVQAPASATILVVDDSPVNLRLVVRTLEGRGYRLLAAKNGRAALDIARRVHPDLILLDVMMPELDGFEVCRTLKARSRDA